MSAIQIELPDKVHERALQLAREKRISLDRFMVVALVEKLSTMFSDEAMDGYPPGYNPNGIASQSPGLAHRAYPGCKKLTTINPEGVAPTAATLRLAQPRWGCSCFFTATQGRRCAPTLGFEAESRWDSEYGLEEICHAPREIFFLLRPFLRDPKDDFIIELAVAARADLGLLQKR
jgi:hypothetical protein